MEPNDKNNRISNPSTSNQQDQNMSNAGKEHPGVPVLTNKKTLQDYFNLDKEDKAQNDDKKGQGTGSQQMNNIKMKPLNLKEEIL